MAKIISEPTAEPITLEEARAQCRIDAEGSPPSHPDDTQLELFIGAAREWAEHYTGQAMCTQTLEMALDAFPSEEIEIPIGPVQSIVSVKYVDDEEVEQTVAANEYTLDEYSDRIWLLPSSGTEWTTAGEFANAVKIRWIAGYSVPGASPQLNPLPKAAKQAMLLVLAHLYKNREETIEKAMSHLPLGACAFLERFKKRTGMA